MNTIRYPQITSMLLQAAPSRAQEVLSRRFGLRGGEPETLESIGDDFDVTRERVRQIEAVGLEKARSAIREKSDSPPVRDLIRDWSLYLKARGNLRQEDKLLADLANEKGKPHVLFLLTLADQFERVQETADTYTAWTIHKDAFPGARQMIDSFTAALEKEKRVLSEQEMLRLYQKEVRPQFAFALPSRAVFSYLDVSKRIKKGPHGLWGLHEWAEITPRGLRDRAYLVYKKEGRPLHFVEVAGLIEKHGFSGNKKRVLPQSVHNDLIRDPRFVLVGRGIYALKEWGYEPGVVRDVIANVIRRNQSPMTRQEIAKEVLKLRQVKESTVALNLQNKAYFTRTADGKYYLAA